MGASRFAGARVLSLMAALIALFCAPQASRADVLEIGDDGAVTVHSEPETVTTERKASPISTVHEIVGTRRHNVRRAVAGTVVRDAIASASSNYSVSPSLVAAVARQESGFNPNAVSKKGARGVMQLMPATQSAWCGGTCSPEENVAAGTAYLKNLLARYHGDIALALAAYNAGPGAVDRFGGIPPYRETTAYVDGVFANLAASALDSEQ